MQRRLYHRVSSCRTSVLLKIYTTHVTLAPEVYILSIRVSSTVDFTSQKYIARTQEVAYCGSSNPTKKSQSHEKPHASQAKCFINPTGLKILEFSENLKKSRK